MLTEEQQRTVDGDSTAGQLDLLILLLGKVCCNEACKVVGVWTEGKYEDQAKRAAKAADDGAIGRKGAIGEFCR